MIWMVLLVTCFLLILFVFNHTLWYWCFPANLAKFLKMPTLKEDMQWTASVKK